LHLPTFDLAALISDFTSYGMTWMTGSCFCRQRKLRALSTRPVCRSLRC